MKLTVERAALLKALGHVQSAVERRNTIPILANVLISADAGQLGLSTTDLDMQIADASSAQVETSGQITAPAHTLYEIVRELPDGADVTLSYTREDPRLEVRAGRARFNLPVLPAGDFPAMSAEGLSEPIAIDTDDFIRLIDKTRFAASTEETRYYLNGVYFHVVVQDGRPMLRAVATDGRRLALAEMPAPEGFADAPGVIIPRKTIGEARRLMDDAGEMVTIAVSAQKVRFGFGRATLVSKVIDGAFPRYEEVLPRANTRVAAVDNRLFAAAVRRVATISNEQSRPVRLAIESGHMTLTVRNIDASQAVEELEVDYEGEAFEIGFNGRYVMDIAAQMGGDVAEFRFPETVAAGGLEPTLVVDPTDAGVQYVLVPMRT
jgi:DNA polymerase-3 subunit beta